MPRYKVYVHVEYEVEAESLDRAYTVVNEGAEFPLTPFSDDNYCNWSEVYKVEKIKDDEDA